MRPRAAYIWPRRAPGRVNVNIAKLQSFAQHAATMFFPHFVSDACPREPHQRGKRCIRLA